MSAPLVGLDYTYTFRREAAFGTAVTASGTQIPTEELTIDHQAQAHSLQRATGLRGAIQDDNWQDQVGATPTASCTFYLSEGMMGLIPAVLQKSSDYAADSSSWSFTTYNYSSLPDFSANQGYFFTLLANSPVSSGDDAYITSAIGTSLTLSIAPDANEGALYASMEFAGKSSSVGQTVAPTVTTPDMTVLYKWSDIGLVKFDSSDITADFISAEWTVANNAKAVPSAPADDFALLRWEVTGSFTMLDDSAVAETLKGLCLNSAPTNAKRFKVYFQHTTDDALDTSGDLLIDTFVILNGFTLDNSEEAKVTFNFTAVFASDESVRPFTLSYYESA